MKNKQNDIFSIKVNSQFSKELPADQSLENISRQVENACYSYVNTSIPKNPELIHTSSKLLDELDIKIEDEKHFTDLMSGAIPFVGFKSYAMCYGGHQFGHWAGQLGDGRAINIAELELKGKNWKFQLKGAGPTPYSRSADGFAVLRSSIREYLCSEAMHSLGVPTTRALSLVKTGDSVSRDMLYNGNPKDEQGAIVCRISPSFIRFGNFQLFAARKDHKNLKVLLDYTLKHHFSHLGLPSKDTYLNFFKELTNSTKELIIHWQRVGFVHGVMNTDNMSILGLTIDYGPYGWLEDYNPFWTPNTTDAQHKRYRFGNQANIALWNLTQLANAIYPLIEEVKPLESILEGFKVNYLKGYHSMMTSKLGLYDADAVDDTFIKELEEYMTRAELDYTLFFRMLSDKAILSFSDFWIILLKSSYLSEDALGMQEEKWKKWYLRYAQFVENERVNLADRQKKMKAKNPKYVLRNYMAQLAIEDAEKGNYLLLDELYQLLLHPYDDQLDMEKWFAKRPDWARNKVGCSMLSCSS